MVQKNVGGGLFKTEEGEQFDRGVHQVYAGLERVLGAERRAHAAVILGFAFGFGVVLNGQLFELPPNEMQALPPHRA
jgi:hypothetical protein